MLYSFNQPEGKFNFVWKSFSLDAWRDPFKYQPLVDAMKLSLEVAAISTGVAIVFGTLDRARALPLPVPWQLGGSTCCSCCR